MRELSKAYLPQDYEISTYQRWEASGFFNPDNLTSDGKPFSISLPPPNATGILHLGHAVMLALQDLMIRFWRLRGRRTLWVPGTDHAAIATQNVAEKKLFKEEGKRRFEYGRAEFVRRVNTFAQESRVTIRAQIRSMGASCDWSRERYTLDEGLSQAVREAFVRMYGDGLIYRGKRIVNWCYRCGTTLADDEVEYKEQKTKFYYLKYGPIIIGTARPETKVLDKVIVVHPDDTRYQEYVGKEFDVPWIDGTVKACVVADKVAEMGIGTGAMTITPAHSFVDFELAQKYGFEVVGIIGQDGRLTKNAGKFAGLKVAEAREKIVEELRAKGLVERIDEEYVNNLSVCYRCGTAIEPLPSEQWFVAVDKPFRQGLFRRTTLKKLALKAVMGGSIKVVPDRFVKTYQQWITNLHDWCISRQIWFGHRIPAWKCGGTESAPQLKMRFADVVIPRVLAGMTRTYRIHDHNFKIGDRVTFENSQKQSIFGYGTITNIERMAIKDIPLADPLHKSSYESLDELLAAFRRHYPPTEKITGDTKAILYTYTFEPKENGSSGGDCGHWYVTNQQPIKLVVSRHGLTDANQGQIKIQGKRETPLDESAVERVYTLAREIKTLGVNAIVTSPMVRTRQTAEIFANELKLSIAVDERLRERNYGLFEGKLIDDIQREHPHYYEDKFSYPIPGAETYDELKRRLSGWLLELKRTHAGQTMLVVGHTAMMRALRQLLLGASNKELSDWRPTFGQLEQYELVGPCPKCGSWRMAQDEDTLDTWFSSGLWTFSTLGWPEKTRELQAFHPTDVLETSYDILFFWVARMVMMTGYLLRDIPFRTVYLHGLVRDKQGKKMSKSAGNGIDPTEMIEKYGADALRLSMVIGNTPGNDFKLYEEKIAGYRNFVNKLWNIVRFANLTAELKVVDTSPEPQTLADRWILSRFSRIASLVTAKIEGYAFSEAGEALYDFTWHELADWYLEVAKLEGGKDEILSYLVTQLLKLWHPFTPFVTETLWQETFGEGAGLLMVAQWPEQLPATNDAAEAEFKILQDVVTALRNFRADNKVGTEDLINFSIVGKVFNRQELELVEHLRTKSKYAESLQGQVKKSIDFSGFSLLIV
ncbi:MAG: class I tRNA ligase family protein [Candidatus Veblenbacteria bacterium]|nr:class I tRNA ligase family protein [Candidatus Veblenbacteria bacterium]